MCLFAVSVFAENTIIKLDTLPTLEEIHTNPNAYVSHLDTFDESAYKEKDAGSVAVMSDLAETPTYYVFPSYYILERTGYFPDVSKLNTAVAEADATAFSTYAATGSRGGNKHIIRIEIPTYITYLDAWCKFEGSSNLKEVYFPTKIVTNEETGEQNEVAYVTAVSGQNTFTSCPKLEYIHNIDKLPLGVWNPGGFGGCNSLLEITLPQGITSLPDGLFEGCYKLGNVKIPEGVTYIGKATFENCDSMTEVILPNTVTTIAKRSFNNMNKLEVINFGAGLSKLTSTDHNLEVIYQCPNVKYIYMPACFATEVQSTGNSILSSGSKVTIFFTGTLEQAEAVRTKLTESADNPLIKNATFVEFDPSINYEGYADTLGYTILVYNYSPCEAFYNGNHETKDGYTIEYSGKEWLSTAIKFKACENCTVKAEAKELAPLFVSLGYSTNGKGGIIQGFSFNKAERAEYEAVIGKVSYGVVASVDKREDKTQGVDVFTFEKYISCDLSNSKFDLFDIMISGITEETGDTALIFCAYTVINGNRYFINNGEITQTVTSISFNEAIS